MAAKFSWKHYYEPTPKLFVKIGHTLMAVSAAGIPTMMMGYPKAGLIMGVLPLIGTILTNFFKDVPEDSADTPS